MPAEGRQRAQRLSTLTLGAACFAVGVAFVLGMITLMESSPQSADVAAAMLRPGEAIAGLLGFTAHDFVGFLLVIPGNMVIYGAALFFAIQSTAWMVRRARGGGGDDRS